MFFNFTRSVLSFGDVDWKNSPRSPPPRRTVRRRRAIDKSRPNCPMTSRVKAERRENLRWIFLGFSACQINSQQSYSTDEATMDTAADSLGSPKFVVEKCFVAFFPEISPRSDCSSANRRPAISAPTTSTRVYRSKESKKIKRSKTKRIETERSKSANPR